MTETKLDLEAALIALVVLAAIAAVTALLLFPLRDNAELQRHYNNSLVACVEAGGDPLECKIALAAGTSSS